MRHKQIFAENSLFNSAGVVKRYNALSGTFETPPTFRSLFCVRFLNYLLLLALRHLISSCFLVLRDYEDPWQSIHFS